jgi:hypothetical protein
MMRFALELLRGDEPLVKAPLAGGAHDVEGRIHQIGQLPVCSLPAGEYVLRLTVRRGPIPEVRDAAFTIVE